MSVSNSDVKVESQPSCLNTKIHPSFIHVFKDKLTVTYIGKGTHTDVGAVQSDRPCPRQCAAYYYEVTIEQAAETNAKICVGIAPKTTLLNRVPGTEPNSVGFRGEDGRTLNSSTRAESYGQTYGKGDVVGCGIDYTRRIIFFTKNGNDLGMAAKVGKCEYYPTVGLHDPGDRVKFNFTGSFAFDIDGMVQKSFMNEKRQISRETVSPSTLQQLVRAYLRHGGYHLTLESFNKATSYTEECDSPTSDGGTSPPVRNDTSDETVPLKIDGDIDIQSSPSKSDSVARQEQATLNDSVEASCVFTPSGRIDGDSSGGGANTGEDTGTLSADLNASSTTEENAEAVTGRSNDTDEAMDISSGHAEESLISGYRMEDSQEGKSGQSGDDSRSRGEDRGYPSGEDSMVIDIPQPPSSDSSTRSQGRSSSSSGRVADTFSSSTPQKGRLSGTGSIGKDNGRSHSRDKPDDSCENFPEYWREVYSNSEAVDKLTKTIKFRKEVRSRITSGDIEKAAELLESEYEDIFDEEETSLAVALLRSQQLIEILRNSDDPLVAVEYMKKYLYKVLKATNPSAKHIHNAIVDACAIIAYPQPQKSPLAACFDTSRRALTADIVNEHILRNKLGMPEWSPLHLMMRHLVSTKAVIRELNGHCGPIPSSRTLCHQAFVKTPTGNQTPTHSSII